MSDDEGRLHDGRKLNVAVSFMLPLELVQQSLVGRLGETKKKEKGKNNRHRGLGFSVFGEFKF